MVDAAVSNTVDESHEGSSPSPGTNSLAFSQEAASPQHFFCTISTLLNLLGFSIPADT